MYNAGTTTTVAGQPATVVTQAPPSTNERYNGKQSFVIGIVLIVVGALGIVFNIVDLGINSSRSWYAESEYWYNSRGYVGHGIWCGIVFIITGVLGIVAGRTKNRCLIIAFLIMAIVGCVFAGIQFIVACVGAGTMGELHDANCRGNSHSACDEIRALVAMEALLAIGAVVAFALCLWGSILCCMGCSSAPQPGAFAVAPSQPMTVITTQQQQQQQPQAYYPGMQPVAYATPAPAGYVQQPPA